MILPSPTAPRIPEPDECCGQGCAVCVWDIYERELDKYHERLRRWVRMNTQLLNSLLLPIPLHGTHVIRRKYTSYFN
jgi:hypothetical protein